MSAKVAVWILKMVATKDGRNTLKTLLTVLFSVIVAIVLVISAILDILTSPIEFAGALGDFQRKYGYLIAAPTSIGGGEPLTEEMIDELLEEAETSDPDRLTVLRTALELVGRVPYFWGGKSAVGWNEDWNTLKLVSAPGVSSSGTLQPYGLDCSGYTDWVWKTAGYKSIGVGVHQQFWRSTRIEEDELIPGDLVFKNWPDDKVTNHVGIYYGKNEDGKNLYIHCSAGAGGVTMNSYSGFTLWGRPKFILKEEEG